jgi:hypothetical protein
MAVYDVKEDKLNDVVTSLNAHGFGLTVHYIRLEPHIEHT